MKISSCAKKISALLLFVFPFNSAGCALKDKNDMSDLQSGNKGENEEDFERAHSVISSRHWSEYRRVWKSIDSAQDFSDSESTLIFFRDMTEYEEDLQNAIASLDSLQEAGVLNSFEKDLLVSVAESRIYYLAGYINTTRMMVPSVDLLSERIVLGFDARMDSVTRFLGEGKISKEQYDSALSVSVEDLIYFSKISTARKAIQDARIELASGWYDISNDNYDILKEIDSVLIRFGALRDEGKLSDSLYYEYETKLNKAKTEIAYFETIIPFVKVLFRDLLSYE